MELVFLATPVRFCLQQFTCLGVAQVVIPMVAGEGQLVGMPGSVVVLTVLRTWVWEDGMALTELHHTTTA
jgi:hypothetical protein